MFTCALRMRDGSLLCFGPMSLRETADETCKLLQTRKDMPHSHPAWFVTEEMGDFGINPRMGFYDAGVKAKKLSEVRDARERGVGIQTPAGRCDSGHSPLSREGG